jgi:hypothetical protein
MASKHMALDGAVLLRQQRESGLNEKAFWREAYSHIMTYNAYHGLVYRASGAVESKIIQLDVPTIEPEPPPPTLDSLSDRERWRGTLTELLHSQPTITVMHPCDRHAPYTDPVADEMWYTLASLVRPDIVVRGSDEDDLPTISKFAEEGAEEPEIGDFLDVMYQTRRYHTRRTNLILPSALQVNIEGNHGWARFIKWVNRKAAQSKINLSRQYIQNLRCDGGVFYIGMKSSVRIGKPLLVHHGKKAGTHAAKATLDMRHSSVSIMAGHTHRPDSFSVVSASPVTAVISGCLCLIPQNYNDDEDDDYCTWQHGTAVGTIDVQSGIADLKEVRFHRHEKRAWFEFGGKVYAFDVQAIEQKAKAAA